LIVFVGYAFQSAWEGKFKALVEVRTKSQASNIAGESHMLQTLIKVSTEDDAFETRGEGHVFQALVKVAACWLNFPDLSSLGQLKRATLRLKFLPKVRLSKVRGSST